MAARESKRDLYEVLGVSRDADADTLRKAYRKLARRYHPDVNPGDAAAEERFKELSNAYAVLSDADKRRNYDEFGEISLEAGFDAEAARRARAGFGARFQGAPGGGSAEWTREEFSFGGLDDLFGEILSQRGRAAGPHRGADLHTEITLDFLDASRGGEQRIQLARPQPDGSTKPEAFTVRIPPGVSDGGRIRLPGKGAPGQKGGPDGDLYLEVRVRPHRVFRREGRDLHLDLPVSVAEATLGAKVAVPTLEGRATLSVPPGTDSGRILRLRGKGTPDPAGGPPGDLLVHVQIRVPRDLDDAARQRFEELRELDPTDLREELLR